MGKYLKILSKILLCYFILYVLQFLVIPVFYHNVLRIGNEANWVAAITTITVTLIGMFVISDKLIFWLLGLLEYALFVFLYTPKYAYGIGLNRFSLWMTPDEGPRWVGIVLLLISIITYQIMIWIFVKIYKLIKKKVKKTN